MKTRNNLKGGNPNDVKTNHGSTLIEQAVSSPKNGSVHRNYKKKVRRFKTKYHKPLNNTIKNHFQHNQKKERMLQSKVKSLNKL